ncbi:hypothetical protein [Embleya sp. MST-111070]|uniref:hypothetical protein n=1 Tax=Embleya sp. MST-111070 TaxID=3398231 RepID=UPI003F737A2E
MTDIRELEAALARHEHLAPDDEGLIEAAYAGARRVRRRRLAVAGLGVAAVVALGAVTPRVLDHLGDDGVRRAAGPAASKAAGVSVTSPPAVVVDVDRTEGFFPLEQGFSGTTSLASVRSDDQSSTGWGGNVGVYAPADVDMTAIEAGEAITVQGHPARYAENYLIDPAAYHEGPQNSWAPKPVRFDADGKPGPGTWQDRRAPVVAWRDSSGSWVVVSGTDQRTDLLRLAEAVRLRPTGARTPYRLGFVPDTLRLDFGGSNTRIRAESNSVLVFGAAAHPVLKRSELRGMTEYGALRIQVSASDSGRTDIVARTGPPTVIAGHDTWYFTSPGGGLLPPEQGAILVTKVNGCEVQITTTDNNLVPRDTLHRILASMTFGNCAAPETWTPPLS